MTDLFSSNNYSLDSCRDLFIKTIDIHENQKLQGFFSTIGMASGDYINFHIPDNLIVIGDIHGDFKTLIDIMRKNNIEQFLQNEQNLLIFLGDYIDRGKYSLEVLIFLCKIKNAFPNNVVLLRGNHEAYEHFTFSGFDLPNSLKEKFGNSSIDLYQNCISPFFESLFILCEINDFALFLHGGLPVIDDLKFYDNYKFFLSNVKVNNILLEEILWNDPKELSIQNNWVYSNRGVGKHFGIYITDRWLNYTKCKLLIRGHEPCAGYKFNHSNKVLTIFSSKEPYPNFRCSYLRLSREHIYKVLDDTKLLTQHLYFI